MKMMKYQLIEQAQALPDDIKAAVLITVGANGKPTATGIGANGLDMLELLSISGVAIAQDMKTKARLAKDA
jgi:hypothetical protein